MMIRKKNSTVIVISIPSVGDGKNDSGDQHRHRGVQWQSDELDMPDIHRLIHSNGSRMCVFSRTQEMLSGPYALPQN